MPIPRWWSGLLDQTDLSPNIALPATVFQPGTLTPSRIGLPFVNKTGGSLPLGSLVFVSGQDPTTGLPQVSLAVNNVQGSRAQFAVLGTLVNGLIVPGAIANNGTGQMGEQLVLTGQNTNAGNVGDLVYLSATPGGYTLTKPGSAATTFVQTVGRITVKSATVGMVDIALFYNQPFVQIGANELVANLIAERPQAGTGVVSVAAAAYDFLPIIVGGFRLSFLQALAAHDTNFITFTVNNITQSLLMTSVAGGGINTTKITGGTAIPLKAGYLVFPHATPANMVVNVNDVIVMTATVQGTLANTITGTWSIGETVT